MAGAAVGQQAESTTPDERALADDTTVEATSTLSFGDAYLDPSSSATCPSKCSVYLAGSKATDARVCQKQGSGVGTPQENAALGVACYPSYGCGQDMIPCVNQAWSGAVPDTSDAAAACAGLDSLVSENPWTCEGMDTNSPACSQGTPNNDMGKWLKGSADLWGGWGANAVAAGSLTRTTYSGTTSDYECCLKAMMHENSSWDQGGAAVRFQYNSGQCTVDTEWLIYTNMDSYSGYALKYADAGAGSPDYFYRHTAGASDAANMGTGGRCVVEGGFTRANDPAASGVNKPWGELPDGAEMPNFACSYADRNTANDMWMIEGACDATIRVNTINDPEACCEFCQTLSDPTIVDTSGLSVTETDGVHDNPCVAWQIVQGKCRIVRKKYFDYYNAGGQQAGNPSITPFTTIQEGIMDDSTWQPGNGGHWIAGRGCSSDEYDYKDPDKWCNYYSYLYYRELGTDSSVVSSANATFRKVVTANLSAGTDNMTIQLSADSVGSRRDSTENTGSEDCGSVEIYEQDACSDATAGYTVVTEESLAACTPLCSSSCISDGQVTLFCQGLAGQIASRRLARGERRLTQDDGMGLLFSFNSQGSGSDQVNFGMSADYVVGEVPDANPDANPGANPTPSPGPTPTPPVDAISDSELGSCPGVLATALVSLATFAAAFSTRQ
jgi:hypothetical protein